MTKRERVEDLGRIYEKIDYIMKLGSYENFGNINPFDDCTSKHSIESFVQKYQHPERLEDLHDWIRWMYERLAEISSISMGDGFYSDES